ncbi:hypothetical protein TNCV_1955421 [Trichonephila clavipes]|nr:hypothetical protein TNCV_1955421 [Trichonephila clavipes]
MGAEVHEQMLRSDGQSDPKPLVFSSQSSLVLFYRLTSGMKTEWTLLSPGFEPRTCGVEERLFAVASSERLGISDNMSTFATCDTVGLGLSPYTIITHSVKRRQSVELVCAIRDGTKKVGCVDGKTVNIGLRMVCDIWLTKGNALITSTNVRSKLLQSKRKP